MGFEKEMDEDRTRINKLKQLIAEAKNTYVHIDSIENLEKNIANFEREFEKPRFLPNNIIRMARFDNQILKLFIEFRQLITAPHLILTPKALENQKRKEIQIQNLISEGYTAVCRSCLYAYHKRAKISLKCPNCGSENIES